MATLTTAPFSTKISPVVDFDALDDATTKRIGRASLQRVIRQVERNIQNLKVNTVELTDLTSAGSDSRTVKTADVEFAAPWLARSLAQLASLRSIGTVWESTGAAPPNEVSLQLASGVLLQLSEIDLKPTNIDPSTDGGVCISFRNGMQYADVECFNSGDIFAVLSRDDGATRVWEVQLRQLRATLATIAEFFSD